ncbi:MAG: hypothetical protein IKR25_11195 [Muribaculaceae bacterium]|nr:hypothetical protein [Muribaculaceae bacterium]
MNENNNPTITEATDACLSCTSCTCHVSAGGCEGRCNLHSTNWLEDIPGGKNDFDIVEVHFKNTRRGFYRNSAKLDLHVGDMVAVEASPGHDIGEVAMTGKLVKLQMKRANLRPDAEILRVFRKAKQSDLERYEEAKAREIDTMIRSRKIAVDLGLKMKIGDVEYQGDGNKAIFYYIADERVDFRQLIKVLADVFKIRVEMKQIGARQEAGRIGGIGPCGRPLCCASWMTSFVSVATSAARFQDISLNPQKLAGQCAKLKCCINFEVDSYVEGMREMPPRDVVLEDKDKQYFQFKADVLKREVSYTTKKGVPENLITLPVDRVFEIMSLNDNGVKPDKLELDDAEREFEKNAFGDILGQDAINRFDKKKRKKKKSGGGQRGDKAEAASGKDPGKKSGGGGKQREKRKAQPGEQHKGDRAPQQKGEVHQQPKGDRQDGGKPRQRDERRPRPDKENQSQVPKANKPRENNGAPSPKPEQPADKQ